MNATRRAVVSATLKQRPDLSGISVGELMHLGDQEEVVRAVADIEVQVFLLEIARRNKANARVVQDRAVEERDGFCVDCEEQIPQKRINALPFAIRCIACQKAFDRDGSK